MYGARRYPFSVVAFLRTNGRETGKESKRSGNAGNGAETGRVCAPCIQVPIGPDGVSVMRTFRFAGTISEPATNVADLSVFFPLFNGEPDAGGRAGETERENRPDYFLRPATFEHRCHFRWANDRGVRDAPENGQHPASSEG